MTEKEEVSLESLHEEFKDKNIFDMVDAMFSTESEVIGDRLKLFVPSYLLDKVKKLVANKDCFDDDRHWFVNENSLKRLNDKLVFSQYYISDYGLFRVFFGFTRGGRDIFNPKEPKKISDIDPFEFSTIFIDNPIPNLNKIGTWGRNTFKDTDFEHAAEVLFVNKKSIYSIPKIIDIYGMEKYNGGSALTLCGDRVSGTLIGSKEDFVTTK